MDDADFLTKPFEDLDGEGRRKIAQHFQSNAYPKGFKWNWKDVHHNRVALVNYVLRKLPMDCAYLEIGCGGNDLFDALPISDKTGVDPVKGGTVRLTSDDFFDTNSKQFDFIWIDGLHEYTQVHRDLINALACLKPGGWIALHDLMPTNWKQEHMPRMHLGWTGDVWKVAMEIAATQGLDFRLVLIDHGVGLLQVDPGAEPLADMEGELLNERFGWLYENIDRLPLTEWDEAVAWIDSRAPS